MVDTTRSEGLLHAAALTISENGSFSARDGVFLGVDLGTASVVLIALDSQKNPIACEIEYSGVVRDGLVVDYMGAVNIVKRLKAKLETRLGARLSRAAIAVPPGTNPKDAGTHRHVVEASNTEVTTIVDEPTAANEVLGIRDGVVVDIGGGTTGLTVFKDGRPVLTADEPTGGYHISLVLMGGRKISFEEAEELKRDPSKAGEVLVEVKPVIQKMAGIVTRYIKGHNADNIWLVGGTCCLPGVEKIFQQETGLPSFKPVHPHLVTPLGIAMSCKQL